MRRALAEADVEIDGRRPWDLRVRDAAFYGRLLRNPAFQLGETYTSSVWPTTMVVVVAVAVVVVVMRGSFAATMTTVTVVAPPPAPGGEREARDQGQESTIPHTHLCPVRDALAMPSTHRAMLAQPRSVKRCCMIPPIATKTPPSAAIVPALTPKISLPLVSLLLVA